MRNLLLFSDCLSLLVKSLELTLLQNVEQHEGNKEVDGLLEKSFNEVWLAHVTLQVCKPSNKPSV